MRLKPSGAADKLLTLLLLGIVYGLGGIMVGAIAVGIIFGVPALVSDSMGWERAARFFTTLYRIGLFLSFVYGCAWGGARWHDLVNVGDRDRPEPDVQPEDGRG